MRGAFRSRALCRESGSRLDEPTPTTTRHSSSSGDSSATTSLPAAVARISDSNGSLILFAPLQQRGFRALTALTIFILAILSVLTSFPLSATATATAAAVSHAESASNPSAATGSPAAGSHPRFSRAHAETVSDVSSRVREVRGLANDVEKFAAFTDDSLDEFERQIEEMAAEAVQNSLNKAVTELTQLAASAAPGSLPATIVAATQELKKLLASGHAEKSHNAETHLQDKIARLQTLRRVETALRSALATHGSVPVETAAALVSVALREHAAGTAEELLSHAQSQAETQVKRARKGYEATGSGADAVMQREYATQVLLLKDLTRQLRDEAINAAAPATDSASGHVGEALTTTATQAKIAQVDALLAALSKGVQSKPVREAEAFIQDMRDSLAEAATPGIATAREAIESLLYRATGHLTKAPPHKDIDVAFDLIEKVLHRGQSAGNYAPSQYEVTQMMISDAEKLLSQLPRQNGHVHAARALLRVALRGEMIDKARQALESSIANSHGSPSRNGDSGNGDGNVRVSIPPAVAAAVREAQSRLHSLLSPAAADGDARSERAAKLKEIAAIRALLSQQAVAQLAGKDVLALLREIEDRVRGDDEGDDDVLAGAQDDTIDPFTGKPYPVSKHYGKSDKSGGGASGQAHEDSAPVDDADARDASALQAIKYARAALEVIVPSAEEADALSEHSEALNLAVNELHFAQRSITKRRASKLETPEELKARGATMGSEAAALRLSCAQTVNHLEQAAKHVRNAEALHQGKWTQEQLTALKNGEASVLEGLYAAQEGLVLLTVQEENSIEMRAARAAQKMADKEMIAKLVQSAEDALSRVTAIDPRVRRAQEILATLSHPSLEIGEAERQVNVDNAERLLAEAAVAHASPEVQIALHDLATFAEMRDLDNARTALSHAPQTLEVVSALADIEEAKLDLTHPGRSPLGLTRERIRRAHGTLIQTEKDMDNIASAGVTSSHASRFLESVGARMEALAEKGIEHPADLSHHDKELVEAASLVNALHQVDELDKARDMLNKLEEMQLLRMRPADKRALMRELQARLGAAERTVVTRRAHRLLQKEQQHKAIDREMDELRAQAHSEIGDAGLVAAIDELHELQEKLHRDFKQGKDLTHREDGHGMGDNNDKDGDQEPDKVSFVTHRAQDYVSSVRSQLYGEKETDEQMTTRELLEVDEILREVKPLHRGFASAGENDHEEGEDALPSTHDDLAAALAAVEELRIAKVRQHSDAAQRARMTALQRIASLISRTAQRMNPDDRSDAFLLSRAERMVRKALTEERIAEAALEVKDLRNSTDGNKTAALQAVEAKLRAAQVVGRGGDGDAASKLLSSVRADLERAQAPVPQHQMARLAALDALREAQRPGARPEEELTLTVKDLGVFGDADAAREVRTVIEGVLVAIKARGHKDDDYARRAPDSSENREIVSLLAQAVERLDFDHAASPERTRHASSAEKARVRRAELLIDLSEAEKALETALELLQPLASGEKAIGRAVKMITEVYHELDRNMGAVTEDDANSGGDSSRDRERAMTAGRTEVLRELDQALGDIAIAPLEVQEKRSVRRAERLLRNAYTILVRHHSAAYAMRFPKTPPFTRRRAFDRAQRGLPPLEKSPKSRHGDDNDDDDEDEDGASSAAARGNGDELAHVEGLMEQLKSMPALADGQRDAGAARRREQQRSQLLDELEKTAEDIRARRPGDLARRLVLPARVTERDVRQGVPMSQKGTCTHYPGGGFHLAAKQCVPDSVCTPTSCNHHGLCTILSGSVHCLCDPGFATEGSRMCSTCTARSARYPDCFTRELTDDFVRDALNPESCTAPLLPTSLNAPGLLHSAQRTVHVQQQYFINTAVNSQSTHVVVEEESLLRVHVFAEHGDLLQSARTIAVQLVLLDSRTVIHDASLFFGEQEAVMAAILAPGVSYGIVFTYDGEEIHKRSLATQRACPTMHLDLALTPASKLQQYGETAATDAMDSRLTADPTLTHQGTNRNPIAPGHVLAQGVMEGAITPVEAAALAAGHGACVSRPHIPTFPVDKDGVFDVPTLGFYKDEQLAIMTGDTGRGRETADAARSAGRTGEQLEQVVYLLTFDIPEVQQRQAFVEAQVEFNFVYGDLRMMLRNAASELLYLATPALNSNSLRVPLGPGRYSLTVLLLRPKAAPVPELPFNLPHVSGAATEHAVTMPECLMYTFRFKADFVAVPELPSGEHLAPDDILTEDCGYNQLPAHLNVPSLMGYHGNTLHFFDTFRYEPFQMTRYTHFELREPSLVRLFVPHDSNHQQVEIRLVHLDHAKNSSAAHRGHSTDATHRAGYGLDETLSEGDAWGAHDEEKAWGDYSQYAGDYDNEDGVATAQHGVKVMDYDNTEEERLARATRRLRGVQATDSVHTNAAEHIVDRGRNSRARAAVDATIVSVGIISKRYKSEWVVAELAPGAYRLDFRVSASRFLPLTETKCEGFSLEMSVQPVPRVESMSNAECVVTETNAPTIPEDIVDGTVIFGARAQAATPGSGDDEREGARAKSLGYSYVARVERQNWSPQTPVATWEFWVRQLPEDQDGLIFDLELEYDFTRIPLIAYLEESLDPRDKAAAESAARAHAVRRAEERDGDDAADRLRARQAKAQRGGLKGFKSANKTAAELADEVLATVGTQARERRADGEPATLQDRNYQTLRRKLAPGFYRLALYLLAPYPFITIGVDDGRPGPLDDFACVEYDMRLRVISPKEEPLVGRCLERSHLRPGLMRLPSSLTSMRFLGSDMLATQTQVQGRFFFPRMQQTQHSLQEHLDAIDADQSHAVAFHDSKALSKRPPSVKRVELVVPAVALLRFAVDALGVPMKVSLNRVLCLSHPGRPLSEQAEGSATRAEPWVKYDMHRTLARSKTAVGCIESVFSSKQGQFSTARFVDPGVYELVFEQAAQTVGDDAHDAADCVGFTLQLALSAVHAMAEPDVVASKVFRTDRESGQYAAWEHANRRERDRDAYDKDEDVDPEFLAHEETRRELAIHQNFRPHALLSDLALFQDFIPLCPVVGSDHSPPSPPPKVESLYLYDSVRRNEHLYLQQRYNEPRSHSIRFSVAHAFRLYARIAFPFLSTHLTLTLTSVAADGLTEYLGEARYNRHVIAVDVAHAGEWILTIADAPRAREDTLKHQGLFCSWYTFRLEIEPLSLSGAGPYGGLLPAALNIPPLNLLMSSLDRVLPRFPEVPATLNSPAMLVPHHSFHHFGAHSLLPPARRAGTAAHVQAGYRRNEIRFRLLHRSLVRALVTPAVRPYLDAHMGAKLLLDCDACDPVAVGKRVAVHTTRHYSWLHGELDVGDYTLTIEPKTGQMPQSWFPLRGGMDVVLELAVAPVAHILTGADDKPYEHDAQLHHAAPTPRGRTEDGKRYALPSADAATDASRGCVKVLKEQSFHVCAHSETMFIQREKSPDDALSLHGEYALCPELQGHRVHTITLALREQSTVGLALHYDFLMTALLPTITDVVNGHRWHGERMQNSYQLFSVLPAGYYNLTIDSLGARSGSLLTDPCLRDTYGFTLQVTPVRPDAEAPDAAAQYQSWAKAQKLAHTIRKHNIPAAALTETDPLARAVPARAAADAAGATVATPAERAQIHARIALLRAAKASHQGPASEAASLALSPVLQAFHADAADAQIARALAAGATCPNPEIPALLLPRDTEVVITSADGTQMQQARRTWQPRTRSSLQKLHSDEEAVRRDHVGVSEAGEFAEQAAKAGHGEAVEASNLNALALAYTPEFFARLSMPYVRAYPGDGSVSAWVPESGEALPHGVTRTLGLSTVEESLLFVDIRAHSPAVRERALQAWSVAADGTRHDAEDEKDASLALPDERTGAHSGIDLRPRITYEFNRGPRHQSVFWLPATYRRARRGWHQFELEIAVATGMEHDLDTSAATGGDDEGEGCHLYSLELAVVPVAALQEHLFRSDCVQKLPPAHIPFDELGRGLLSLPDGVWQSGLVDQAQGATRGDDATIAHGKSYRMRLHVMEDAIISSQLRFSFVTASFRMIIYKIEDDGEAYEFARARNVPAVLSGRHEVPLGHALSFDQSLDVSIRLPQGNYHIEIQEQMSTALHEILGRLALMRAEKNGATTVTKMELKSLTSQPLCVPFAFFFEMTPVYAAREHGTGTHMAMQRIAAEAQQLAAAAAANGGVLPPELAASASAGSAFSHGESVCRVEACGCKNADVFAHSRDDANTNTVSAAVATLPRGMRANQCQVAGTCTPLATAAAKRNAFVCQCARGYSGARCERCAYGYANYPTCTRLPTKEELAEAEEERLAAEEEAEVAAEEAAAQAEAQSLVDEWGSPSSLIDTKVVNGTTIISIPTDFDIEKAFSNPFVVPFDVHSLAIGADLKKNLISEPVLPPTHSKELVSKRTGKKYHPAVTIPTTPNHIKGKGAPITKSGSAAAASGVDTGASAGVVFTSAPTGPSGAGTAASAAATGERRIHCARPCYRGRCDYTTGRCVTDIDVVTPSKGDVSTGHEGTGRETSASETVVEETTPAELLEQEALAKAKAKAHAGKSTTGAGASAGVRPALGGAGGTAGVMFIDPRASAWDRLLSALAYTLGALICVLACAVLGLLALDSNSNANGNRQRWPTSAAEWAALLASGLGAAAGRASAAAGWAFRASGARSGVRSLGKKVGLQLFAGEGEDRAALIHGRGGAGAKGAGAARHQGVTFGECVTATGGRAGSGNGNANGELSLDDDASEMEGGGRIRRTATGNGGAGIARVLQ